MYLYDIEVNVACMIYRLMYLYDIEVNVLV